ncbi:MAG TPA: class I SAM-dependent methyltransferase [Candidatus Paceibacterota bacterium]|nr:class I SAM-dependent methyltransferase [Candidatus Paceibacterota bacterium]
MKNNSTSWSSVAPWYDEYLETSADSYQAKVIAPNLLRMLELKKGEAVLDVGCGQGYFSRLLAEAGAAVTGIDISEELITCAKEKGGTARYFAAPAHDTKLKAYSFDTTLIVLALENIKNIDQTFAEIARVLKKEGRVVLVMLHPAFRIPQFSDWGFDTKKNLQYRRVDKYLSEAAIEISQNPFKGTKEAKTVTYHRSLQWYMKVFKKHGFSITAMEEWISHKKSAPGIRQEAEDRARKEFPMFLALEIGKK